MLILFLLLFAQLYKLHLTEKLEKNYANPFVSCVSSQLCFFIFPFFFFFFCTKQI